MSVIEIIMATLLSIPMLISIMLFVKLLFFRGCNHDWEYTSTPGYYDSNPKVAASITRTCKKCGRSYTTYYI